MINRTQPQGFLATEHDSLRYSRRIPLAAASVACIAIIVQAVALWVMYESASSNLRHETERRLSAAGASSFSFLDDVTSRTRESSAITSALARLRAAHGLNEALLVDGSGKIMADAFGTRSAGTPPSVFDVNPAYILKVLKANSSGIERMTLLQNHYIRYYHPIALSGTERGVLVLSIHDSSPSEIRHLQKAMAAGLGASITVALLIGAVVFLAASAWHKALGKMMRMERLAMAGTMAASIAHEIKNPLGIALSATQVLKKKTGFDGPSLQLLNSAELEIRRSADQIDGFLDLTRDIAMKLREEDVCELVRDTTKLLNARIAQDGIFLAADIPPHPIFAAIDRSKFRRMLVNLLLNACEALAEKNEGRIDVRISEPGDNAQCVQIVIRDNGPGIPESELSSVMDPFFTTKPNGTGLGLAVARQIIERHGGRLEMFSEEGRGVRATIELPKRSGSA